MHRFFQLVCFLIIGTMLGLQNIYWGVLGINVYTVWFFALILISGIVGMTTRKVRQGMLWGILLWIYALAVYETTLGLLQWSHWYYPFDIKSLIEGLILILVVGIPVSWISSWLSIKEKTVYFGAIVLSIVCVWFLSKMLIPLLISGAFGHGF